MAFYAVLGATGNTGQALLKLLLRSPDNRIHAYCRSKQKLEKLLPDAVESKQLRVFEGNLQDIELLATCLSGTKAVFLAVGLTDNQPHTTIAYDTAQMVVSALERLESKKERLPALVALSSASLDHRLMAHVPQFLLDTLYCAFSNIYNDLREAEKFLRSKEPMVSTTFIRPGALCHDEQKGHFLSLTSAKSPLSFLDLAAGMIEVANEDSGMYSMKGVAVNTSSKDVAFPWDAPLLISRGLLFHFFPWIYQYLA
jgi:oxidoreductase AflX